MTRAERLFIEKMTPAQRDAEIVEKLLDIITALSGVAAGTTMEEIGSIKAWPVEVIPTKWLLCYGQQLSLAVYPELGQLIGTTYGPLTDGIGGVGTTHFRIPDLRGKVIAGKDDMGGVAANLLTNTVDGEGVVGNLLGSSGGTEGTTLNLDQIPTHHHEFTANADDVQNSEGTFPITGVSNGDIINTSDTGGDPVSGHNNVQPTYILNWIIKAL